MLGTSTYRQNMSSDAVKETAKPQVKNILYQKPVNGYWLIMKLYLAYLGHQNTASHANKLLQWMEEHAFHLV